MIVEQVAVRHWRRLRGDHSFALGTGLNLLEGPNEAGKSSVLEAIVTALVERHSTKAAHIRRIRPLGSSLAPEVTLTVLVDGERYRVRKRFLEDPMAELWREHEGELRLEHEGDAADRVLRELFQISGGRNAGKPQQRGLAEALWYLQGEPAVPAKEWNEALHQGLEELLETLRTPQQRNVLSRLEDAYAAHFTPTGRIRAGSELKELTQEREQLEGELGRLREEALRTDELRRELQSLVERRQALERSREGAEARRRELRVGIERGPEHEERIRRAETLVAETRRGVEVLQQGLRRIRDLETRGGRLETQLEELRRSEKATERKVREQRRLAERHARRWEDELTPRLEARRRELEDLRSKQRIEDLELETASLAARLDRMNDLRTRLAELEQRSAALPAPDEREYARCRELLEEVRLLEAEERAHAVRVELRPEDGVAAPELLDGAPQRETGNAELVDGLAWLVVGATRFHLPGYGSLEVRPQQPVAETVLRRLERAREEAGEAFRRFGVEDLQGLTLRRDERVELEGGIRELQARLSELGDAGAEELEERLATAREELAELRERSPQAVLPGMERWAEERTADAIRQLEATVGELEKGIKEARATENEAQQTSFVANEQLKNVSREVTELEAERKSLRSSVREELRRLGSPRDTAEVLEREKHRLAKEEGALETLREIHRREVLEPQRELRTVERELEKLTRDAVDLQRQEVDRRARIEAAADLGRAARIDDLEGRQTELRRRARVVERRARAARLLHELARHLQAEETRSLIVPIRAQLDAWLARLTRRRHEGVLLDERLLPEGVASPGAGGELPMESLSWGTREQMVVLLRLALAVVLSSEERQFVILDDRLVNADEERMARFAEILEEAAESCQVLIATCRPESYAGLTARRLEVDRRESFPREAESATS